MHPMERLQANIASAPAPERKKVAWTQYEKMECLTGHSGDTDEKDEGDQAVRESHSCVVAVLRRRTVPFSSLGI